MESNQIAKKDKDSYKFQIAETEELDLWAIVPLEGSPDKHTLASFFTQICTLCPAVENCKPHIIVTRNSSVLIMGENRDTEDCTYAQNYISPRYQGRMNVNIEP